MIHDISSPTRILMNGRCEFIYDRGNVWAPMGHCTVSRLAEALDAFPVVDVEVQCHPFGDDKQKAADLAKFARRLAKLPSTYSFAGFSPKVIEKDGVMMLAAEILDALADDAFQSLTNNGDGWTINYVFDEDEERGSMTNSSLDSLMEDFVELLYERQQSDPAEQATELLDMVADGVPAAVAVQKVFRPNGTRGDGHGLYLIVEDTAHRFYRSEYGIKVVPWSDEWSGYYRLSRQDGTREWTKLFLSSFCHGKAPGELVISIRSYEDIEKTLSE
jgi:hypothetical protein